VAIKVGIRRPWSGNSPEDVAEIQRGGDDPDRIGGLKGETIAELMNGLIWQRSEHYYHYH